MLDYVFRRYPRLHSAMVANHNCFQARGALREVAKVHGRPAGEIREVTRRIPFFEDGERRLPDLVATHPNFRGLNLRPAVAGVRPGGGGAGWNPPSSLGTRRWRGDHADGPDRLRAGGARRQNAAGSARPAVPVIQFEKDGTEDAGLVKIDLLGNRSLAVIRDAIEAVHGNTKQRIDYTSSTPVTMKVPRHCSEPARPWGCFTPSLPPRGCSAPRAGQIPSSCWCSIPA